jgi:hypothetical protein
MRQVAGQKCDDGVTCDGVWLDGAMLVLRGEALDQATLPRATHEAVIRLPVDLVAEALTRGR